MKLLICGGRDFQPSADMADRFLSFCARLGVTEVIHGGARGADTEAGNIAKAAKIPVSVYPADWKKHGKAAGPIRNQLMLDDGKPDCVLAFPGGRGTADMVRRAKEAGVRVVEVSP